MTGLKKHAAHSFKKGRTHLLRSPGRPLLLSPLENLAQILHTKPRISAAEKMDKEMDMGPDTTSLNMTPTHHTHALNMAPNQRT